MKKGKLLLLGAVTLGSFAGITACQPEADIGILQFGAFDALDNARKGFIDGLEENGLGHLKIDYKNAQADGATNQTLATGMAGRHKLNLAIATPCATALKAAQENIGSEVPLLFTAVTDAVGAGLVNTNEVPGGFTTGSSDAQPTEALSAQIGLVKQMMPDATKLGILYTASETNSVKQANLVRPIAEAQGLTVTVSTCSDQFDISAKALDLASKVDAIWIPTDNTIANNVNKIKEAVDTRHVLLVMGEEGMVSGGHVSVSIDYYSLGKETAKMAAKILKEDKKAAEIPVFIPTIDTCSYVCSSANLQQCGFNASSLPSNVTWKDIDAK